MIRISDASAIQLQQLTSWLKEEYTVSTDERISARLSISYNAGTATGTEMPFVRFESVHTDARKPMHLSYQLPEEQISPSVLKVIISLLLQANKEVLDNKNYRMAFDRAHDLIFLADCDHNIIRANHSATRILGYSEAELQSMNLADLFYSKAAGNDFIGDICERGRVVHWEYRLKTKEGNPVEVMLSADMMNEDDKIFLCIAQDISARKEDYKRRKQEEHLVIMGKMAQMIAHEVRNPLNNILLAVSQLKAEPRPLPDEEQAFLDIIDRNCMRINDLVTDMLEPGRLLEMTLTPGSLNTLIREALYLIEDRMTLRHIKITEVLARDYEVMMDKEKMLICICNILLNAIEAIEHDDGRILIRTRQSGDRVLLSIEDNGKGMTENEKNNIFNPYFTTKPRGTGMGMAATQQIIRAHHGAIQVISEKHKGAEILISLPLSSENKV